MQTLRNTARRAGWTSEEMPWLEAFGSREMVYLSPEIVIDWFGRSATKGSVYRFWYTRRSNYANADYLQVTADDPRVRREYHTVVVSASYPEITDTVPVLVTFACLERMLETHNTARSLEVLRRLQKIDRLVDEAARNPPRAEFRMRWIIDGRPEEPLVFHIAADQVDGARRAFTYLAEHYA